MFKYLLGLVSIASAATIDNTKPKTDVEGNLMDVHDGTIVQWNHEDQLYYWYGMGYQDCTLETGLIPPRDCPGIYHSFGRCGFREDHMVNLYTSPDLENWTYVSDIYPMDRRQTGIYFRPKVIYNEKNKEYVLWINYLAPAWSPLASYPKSMLTVATSKTPDGPFITQTWTASLSATGPGDFTILVDPKDQAGYLIYDAWGNNHTVLVEKLEDDYLNTSSDQPVTVSDETGVEAPMVFERNGWYYVFFGPTCCFCRQGSGAQVYTAPSPMGPWTNQNLDINPKHGFSFMGEREIKGQNNFFAQLNGQYIYTSDLWTTAPDKLKSHDIQYWAPVSFNDDVTPPLPRKLRWQDTVEISTDSSPAFTQ